MPDTRAAAIPADEMPSMTTLAEIERTWAPTVDIPRACVPFGISRSHGYELAARGEFPAKVLRVGGRYRVITSSIVEVLRAGAPA